MSIAGISLQSGGLMPYVGYGTWKVQGEDLEKSLENALESGYRHIDTATAYENEEVIGEVLQKWITDGKLKREDLFITTKLPPMGVRPEGVERFLSESLKKLKVDYVDLYLIHTPFTFQEGGDLHPFDEDGNIMIDTSTDHLTVWKKMEEQVDAGKTKAIGISNFNQKQISRILENCRIPPANLQIEMHLYLQQNDVRKFCEEKGISVTAYSPLGSKNSSFFRTPRDDIPFLLEHPKLVEISQKIGKTPAQVALRHLVQKAVAVIPQSSSKEHIESNINIFDFCLDNDTTKELDELNINCRLIDFTFFKGIEKHPEYPF